ncbi:MAG: GNAT family N-acetyltransferase [Thermodesulfobacteriota bacterium]|jgi:amino-acid N-acetyltransferase|nr:GNAT family N-acetyltransferase [Thermodesulfobacteriota bacterium]
MVFLFAHPPQLSSIRDLLARCGLPHDDLNPDNVVHFLTCRTEGMLAGATGMEIFGEEAVLRPPAVEPDMRGRGIGSLLLVRIERFAAMGGARRFYAPSGLNDEYLLPRGYRRAEGKEIPEVLRRHAVFGGDGGSRLPALTKDLVATKMPAAKKAGLASEGQ